jgi:hypothetical protein
MTQSPAEVGATYFDGWMRGDFYTWFDLHTTRTEPMPTVNWRHIQDGKITSIRVTFDPRPLTG